MGQRYRRGLTSAQKTELWDQGCPALVGGGGQDGVYRKPFSLSDGPHWLHAARQRPAAVPPKTSNKVAPTTRRAGWVQPIFVTGGHQNTDQKLGVFMPR